MIELWQNVSPYLLLALMLPIMMVIGLIIRRLKEPNEDYFPYRKKQSIMTPAEQAFFRKLELEYGNQYYIFPQINLDKLIDVEPGTKDYSYRNKISQKSVDYILVDKTSFATIKAIELDDSSHQKTLRIERDKFLNNLFRRCKVELIRFNPIPDHQV